MPEGIPVNTEENRKKWRMAARHLLIKVHANKALTAGLILVTFFYQFRRLIIPPIHTKNVCLSTITVLSERIITQKYREMQRKIEYTCFFH